MSDSNVDTLKSNLGFGAGIKKKAKKPNPKNAHSIQLQTATGQGKPEPEFKFQPKSSHKHTVSSILQHEIVKNFPSKKSSNPTAPKKFISKPEKITIKSKKLSELVKSSFTDSNAKPTLTNISNQNFLKKEKTQNCKNSIISGLTSSNTKKLRSNKSESIIKFSNKKTEDPSLKLANKHKGIEYSSGKKDFSKQLYMRPKKSEGFADYIGKNGHNVSCYNSCLLHTCNNPFNSNEKSGKQSQKLDEGSRPCISEFNTVNQSRLGMKSSGIGSHGGDSKKYYSNGAGLSSISIGTTNLMKTNRQRRHGAESLKDGKAPGKPGRKDSAEGKTYSTTSSGTFLREIDHQNTSKQDNFTLSESDQGFRGLCAKNPKKLGKNNFERGSVGNNNRNLIEKNRHLFRNNNHQRNSITNPYNVSTSSIGGQFNFNTSIFEKQKSKRQVLTRDPQQKLFQEFVTRHSVGGHLDRNLSNDG
jgi:hypothetical protein